MLSTIHEDRCTAKDTWNTMFRKHPWAGSLLDRNLWWLRPCTKCEAVCLMLRAHGGAYSWERKAQWENPFLWVLYGDQFSPGWKCLALEGNMTRERTMEVEGRKHHLSVSQNTGVKKEGKTQSEDWAWRYISSPQSGQDENLLSGYSTQPYVSIQDLDGKSTAIRWTEAGRDSGAMIWEKRTSTKGTAPEREWVARRDYELNLH